MTATIRTAQCPAESTLATRHPGTALDRDALQRAIFNSSTFSSIATDAEGVIQIFNVGAERMLGYTATEVMNTITPAEISDQKELVSRASTLSTEYETPIAPGFEAMVYKAARGIEDIYELTYIRKDGSRLPALVSVTALRDPQESIIGYLLIGTDNTSRQLVEEELEKQYQQAQKMEAVGRLAAGVAHDFNNLLTVITGFAEFVANSLPDKVQASDVAEIIKAADRAAALTQQLLAFSRQQVLRTAPVDVNDLIAGMSSMITRLIGADISVQLALRSDLSPALADQGQIEQVLMNLVVNARDAMPDGGTILIETDEVELEDSPFHEERVESGTYLMLAVTDTGTGMSKETQKRLFEPFYTTKKVGEGTGLGLSTSYGIVKQSNGHIWVYSELGAGTTFKIYLPRSREGLVPGVHQPPSSPTQQITGTLLVVEDESSVRELTTRILREAGFRVLIAANGADAKSLFDRHRSVIDLVLTDVVMPGVGGPELLAHLHIENPELPVLYMSGYTEQSIAARAGLDRGLPFLQKPFTAAELLRSVRRTLDGRADLQPTPAAA